MVPSFNDPNFLKMSCEEALICVIALELCTWADEYRMCIYFLSWKIIKVKKKKKQVKKKRPLSEIYKLISEKLRDFSNDQEEGCWTRLVTDEETWEREILLKVKSHFAPTFDRRGSFNSNETRS